MWTHLSDFVRDSINTYIEPWTPQEIEEAMTTECPRCGHRTDPEIITMNFGEEAGGPGEEG